MAGELNLVSSTTVTSDVASVSLTGIDTTYDIYKVLITNARGNNVAANSWRMRWIVGGSPETGNNYFSQWFRHYGTVDFQYNGLATDYRYSGNTLMYLGEGGADTGESFNANASGDLLAIKGGGYRKAKQTCTGVQIFVDSYSIASGFFGLFGYNYS